MNLLKNTLMIGTLLFAFSCAHSGNKACCENKMSQACMKGQCKIDKSCCDNKCGKCTGKKDSCKKAQCSMKKKS